MRHDLEDVEAHLRGASDAVLLLQAEVGKLELHKRAIDPGEPRFEELAAAVRTTAAALAEFSAAEEIWAQRSVPHAAGELRSITKTPAEQSLARILDRWRAIERQLDQAEPGSAEAAALFAEFQALRAEYMSAFRQHTGRGSS